MVADECRPSSPNTASSLEDVEPARRFDRVEGPLFTILIPVKDQWHLTRRALAAVADHTNPQATPYEVILADDGSRDETRSSWQVFPGLRLVPNDTGLAGFVGNVNRAAREARGTYLVLINNDTEVQDRWLDAILETFLKYEKVGIVGGKLIYPDGKLQEAGSSVFRDGTTQNEGRYADPRDPRYDVERVCDYVSGACLAIRTDLWRHVGGFDERYAPAYCEDVDLALKVWSEGYSVVYQPRCEVLHVDGGTMQEVRSALLEENRRKLVLRWETELENACDANLGSVSKAVLAQNPVYTLLFSSPARKLWRRLPLAGGLKKSITARILSRAFEPQLPKVAHRKQLRAGRVTVAGFLQSGLGQGEAARLDIQALHELGFAPARLDVTPAFQVPDLPDRSFASTIVPTSGPLLIRVNGSELPVAFGYMGRRLVEDRLIIGCWAWELPKAPADWSRSYATIDELWVPSSYCAHAFRGQCPVEVHVVPHPVRRPPTAGRGRRDFGLPENAVVFLAMSDMRSSFDRKNLVGAITAFLDACGDDPRARLVLKVHHVNSAPRNMGRLKRAIGKAKNVQIVDQLFSRAEAGDFLRAADVLLSPHRAEGFGLALAEAMLLEKPVVATKFSGNVDFMPEGTAELLDFELVPVRDFAGMYGGAGQEWAEPDLTQAAEAIAKLATSENRRRELGSAARAFSSRYFSVEEFGCRLSQRFLANAARF